VIGDEYEEWQKDREPGDRRIEDPIAYWVEKQDRYPRLSRMALDFLTIQFMSAEFERVFSAARKMVVASGNHLEAEVIGICQVLRSWYLAGVIEEVADIDLSPLEPDEQSDDGDSSDEDGAAILQNGSEGWVTSEDCE
jgi:hypothetical protein